MHSEGGSSPATGTPGGRYPAPPGTAPATPPTLSPLSTKYTRYSDEYFYKMSAAKYAPMPLHDKIYSAVLKPSTSTVHIC